MENKSLNIKLGEHCHVDLRSDRYFQMETALLALGSSPAALYAKLFDNKTPMNEKLHITSLIFRAGIFFQQCHPKETKLTFHKSYDKCKSEEPSNAANKQGYVG